MTEPKGGTSRREFLKDAGRIAGASALAGVAIPAVHAGEENEIQVALIGCGGRGTGAAADCLSVKDAPLKLTAMVDVFDDNLKHSYENLQKDFSDKMDVPDERKYIGFDGYKKAMEGLKPGSVVVMATPPAFRWVMFSEAIDRNLHVFMEKPLTVDGPTTRKMLELGEKAKAKNLKVGVGLMCRHCDARQELHDRIKNGEIGDLLMLRAYRQTGPVGSAFSGLAPEGTSELLWQIKRFHSFLWASGGCFSDFLIHNIDECCWMKDAWPVKAQGSGGRVFRGDNVDQNFDNYSVEYTFEDGTKMFLEGRNIEGCHNEFASFAQGSKGSAVISSSSHTPARSRIYKSQNIGKRADLTWSYPPPEANPYRLEWDALIDAIRNDKPYNEVERGAKASLVTSMGRKACHSGQVITFDDMLNDDHEFAPELASLTFDSPAPLQKGPNGLYPLPAPGLLGKREF